MLGLRVEFHHGFFCVYYESHHNIQPSLWVVYGSMAHTTLLQRLGQIAHCHSFGVGMAMVAVVTTSEQKDSQPKLIGFVQGSAANQRWFPTFMK